MGSRIDMAIGRVKEATGVLTGNKELKRTGKSEQLSADAARNIDKGAAEAKKALNQAKSSAEQAVDKSSEALRKAVKKQK